MNFSNLSANNMRWKFRTDDERTVEAMRQRFSIPDILARILVGRGVLLENVGQFLEPKIKDLMPDPYILKDMQIAVEHIANIITKTKKIGIFGDYDVDGATSSALLLKYFRSINIETIAYIPDRKKDGYGPNIDALLALQKRGYNDIITVDCGCVAFEPLSQAKQAGINMIVIDHHIGAANLPKAVAVINPNRIDENNNLQNLAAVGVTFLFIAGLNRELRKRGYFKELPEPKILKLLDIVALGTVCDVVKLTGLNRAFVKQGLKIMQARTNKGISILADISGINEKPNTYHLGFCLGPRINAGGRVGKSSLGMELLSGTSDLKMQEIANKLNDYNIERKTIENEVLEQATIEAKKQVAEGRQFILIAKKNWHEGVIGIVAGRLKDKFQLPTAIGSLENKIAKFSARSVIGADIGSVVAKARDKNLLIRGGGHAAAAGFSIIEKKLQNLHLFFEENLASDVQNYQDNRILKLDTAINADAINEDLIEIMNQAAPFGMGNPAPHIVIKNADIMKIDILKNQHLRLFITSGVEFKRSKNNFVKAMCFRAIDTPLGDILLENKGKKLHLAGTLKQEFWQGRKSISFFIEDAMKL